MKNIYILFIVATFSLNLFCQQDNVIVLDSTYTYYWHSNTKDWVISSRSIYAYAYAAHGNHTESISYLWNSEANGWVYSEKEVSNWSELSNNIVDLNFVFYPHPFSDYTTIRLSNALQTLNIELIDNYGRIVRTIDNVNRNLVTIHREYLSSGIYFIRIHSDEIYTEKVIFR